MTTKEIINLALLVSPILLIQIGMAIYALIDLASRTKTRGPRWAWALGLIITFFGIPSGIIVSGVYLAWGRHAEV
jgi:D-alanyl-lipoteichoic acid acyltransferase DltB (MBOAT superfamily)